MKPSYVAGIDYSMTCPAITLTQTNEPFCFTTCELFYLSEKPTKAVLENVCSSRLEDYTSNEERFDLISNWACDVFPAAYQCDVEIFIEDYSFGSKGKVFHIAENAGLLKHKLWQRGFKMTLVAPSVVKQTGFGKGNATKDQMYAAFLKETGVNLMQHYQPKAKSVGSPVGDLVDSFYLCKYGYKTINTK